MKQFVAPVENMVRKEINANKRVLLEGAQGILLDIDVVPIPMLLLAQQL